MISAVLAYLATGAVAGFFAGLFGVGGGLIIVPALSFIFASQGFPASHILHFALGTSLASIVFTSVSSVRSHHLHGAVDWLAVRRIAPGIIAGTLLGALLAAQFSTWFLKFFFIVFLFYAGTQMLLNFRPAPTRSLPGVAGTSAAGLVIGMVSSWVGIGGGTLSVPFLAWCNVTLHRAIGTSSAIGFPIAVSGAVGYALTGYALAGKPAYSLGFIYLPALLALVLTSALAAPLGARVTHRLPVAKLKRYFALLLYALGVRMALS